MESLKNLWNELKPKENKYVLEGSNLKIGKGVIVCNDNEIIPLDAISFIETFEQGKRGYKKCIYIEKSRKSSNGYYFNECSGSSKGNY